MFDHQPQPSGATRRMVGFEDFTVYIYKYTENDFNCQVQYLPSPEHPLNYRLAPSPPCMASYGGFGGIRKKKFRKKIWRKINRLMDYNVPFCTY